MNANLIKSYQHEDPSLLISSEFKSSKNHFIIMSAEEKHLRHIILLSYKMLLY